MKKIILKIKPNKPSNSLRRFAASSDAASGADYGNVKCTIEISTEELFMSFELKATHELIQIASAGGWFRLDSALRPTHELVQIANAASKTGARVTFAGLKLRPTHELVQIASAGKGCVFFEG